jgi:hypothetical protein
MSLPITPATTAAITTATTTASRFYTCPDDWPSGLWCDHHHPGDQPATASAQALLNNTIRVLQFSLLTFVVLRLLARFVSIGALVGLCLIVGGFLYDVGFGLPSVDAAATKTKIAGLTASSEKESRLGFERVGAGSGYPRSTSLWWILSAALTVLVLALVTRYPRRGMPGLSKSTKYRPLAGHLSIGSKPVTPMENLRANPVDSKITTKPGGSEHVPTRTTLPTTIAILFLIALLIPMAFADPNPEVTNIKRSAQGDGDISPIWITYYSTTTTWLPAVTVTAPPVVEASSPTTGSVETSVGTDWSSIPVPTTGSGSVCTEAAQAVCPVVEGRKMGVLVRVVAVA